MEFQRFGPLEAAVVTSPQFESADEAERLTVVLLHGYGAPGTDLASLGRELIIQLPELPLRFVFPMAPKLLDPRAGQASGRAWWEIDMMRLQVAVQSRSLDALAAQVPAGLAPARAHLDQTITALRAEGDGSSRLVVGGFSQGAMLTADWTFRSQAPPLGLILLSGTILCEGEWSELLPTRAGLPVFQSHSPDDFILPFELAERLQRKMSAAGLENRFVEFAGGHGISRSVLAGVAQFLRDLA